MSGHERPLVGLDELARMLEAYEGPSDPRARPPRHAPDRRWTLAVAAGALAVGAGTGFALASTAAPTADARGDTEGFGFLPARGWNVMQSGSLDRDGVARAIAANVPIDPRDSLAGEPRNTLHSLPPRGIVISVNFTPRGDPAEDVAFAVRDEPLRLELAEPVARPSGAAASDYRLRAGIDGYNVDTRVYLGSADTRDFVVAERQLERLVVASDQVTIFARPTIGDKLNYWTTLYGSVDSNRAGESVVIQAKDCRSGFFRVTSGATTVAGGGWSTRYVPGVNTTVRAVWNEVASSQVALRVRAPISLDRERLGRGYRVGIFGTRQSFWRKRVLIQRRQGGSWTTVKSVALTEPGWTKFGLSVPRGIIRAVVPLSQTKPCYLAGISNTLRT